MQKLLLLFEVFSFSDLAKEEGIYQSDTLGNIQVPQTFLYLKARRSHH